MDLHIILWITDLHIILWITDLPIILLNTDLHINLHKEPPRTISTYYFLRTIVLYLLE